jgi:hypothetical protein
MVVRLVTALAGPSGSWAVGDLYSCDEPTARRLIAAGYAVPLTAGAAPVVIDAAIRNGGPEHAMQPRGRRTRG